MGDLPYNEVNSIMRARDNLMWIGMLGGGVCKIQTAGMKFEFNRSIRCVPFNTSSVRSMYYIGEGEYWLGLLDFGLIRYNTRSGRIVSYREHPDLCVLPYTSTVNAIIRRNATSELCFATWSSGVWCYDEKRHRVRQINRNTLPLFADDCVLALREDPDGNLWIGSRSGIYIESASGSSRRSTCGWAEDALRIDAHIRYLLRRRRGRMDCDQRRRDHPCRYEKT